MKLTHICNYAPGFSGMYGTVRDLILEERKLGHEANVIDDAGGILKDKYGQDGITPVDVSFGDESDIICWHHAMAESWLNEPHRNIALFLHGTPEFNFFGELYEKEDKALSLILGLGNYNIPKVYITMWERHKEIWEALLKKPVHYIPAWTDVDNWKMSEYKPVKGELRIALVDFWRITREPFNIFMAIECLRRKYPRLNVKVDAWGLNEIPNTTWQAVIQYLIEDDVLTLKGRSDNPEEDIYHNCDLVVSMSTEETRVVREAYSCGVPVVCARGELNFTDYTCDAINPEKFAKTIYKCYTDLRKNTNKVRNILRSYAIENFDVKKSAKKVIEIFDGVIKQHGSVNYPKYPAGKKMVNSIYETANKIRDRIVAGKQTAYVRFGDGDLLLIDGESRESFHNNSPELQEALIKAFTHKEDGYIISSVAGMVNEGRCRKGLFARHEWDEPIRKVVEKYHPDEVLDNAIALAYMSVFEPNWFVDFLQKCVHGRKVLFVGGEDLCNSALIKNVFDVKTFISLPMKDAFYSLDEDKMNEIIRQSQEHDIMICASGMATRVLAERLWIRKVRIDFIDIGSVADALAGIQTRTWIKMIDLNDYQNNYASVFMPSKTDIVVLTHGQEEKTINCFKSIAENTNNYRVIWVDNGSGDESIEKVKSIAENLEEYELIKIEKNLGFSKGVNIALRKILYENKSDYVVLLNNDTIVTKNWLNSMISSMLVGGYNIVGPLTSENNPQSLKALKEIVDDLPEFKDETLKERAEILQKQYGTKALEIGSMLSFFCVLIHKETLEQVGLLDENIFAYGEDNDMCERIRRLNMKMGLALGAYVHHDHHATSKNMGDEWIEKEKKKSMKYLSNKWTSK